MYAFFKKAAHDFPPDVRSEFARLPEKLLTPVALSTSERKGDGNRHFLIAHKCASTEESF
jgi:hypothetical protein